MFGKVLYVPKLLVEEQDFSMSRVGILVGESFIVREVVALKWKNQCYRVMAEEEEEVWDPDCLKNSVEVSSGEDSPLQSSPMIQVPVDHFEEAEGFRQLDSQEVGEGSAHVVPNGDMGKGGSFEKVADDFVSSVPEEGLLQKSLRPRRCRRRSGRTHSSPPNLDHGGFLDSVEKVRPIKRSRAQFSGKCVDQSINGASDPVESDPFSLNRFLDQFNKNSANLGEVQIPDFSDKEAPSSHQGGCQFDLNNVASSKVSKGSVLGEFFRNLWRWR
ncbi:hypothetical protein Hanom_Chr12g01095861 [Helianthus anomalus]